MPLIEIGDTTRDKLDAMGISGESYNAIIERLLIIRDSYHEMIKGNEG